MYKHTRKNASCRDLTLIGLLSLSLMSCVSTNSPKLEREVLEEHPLSQISNKAPQISARTPQTDLPVYSQIPRKEKLRIRLTPAFLSKSPEHRIAVDLLHAMLQILPLNQHSHSLVVMTSNSTFSEALKDTVAVMGFSNDRGSNLRTAKSVLRLDFSVTPERSKPEGTHYTYLIKIGGIRVKRTFRVNHLGSQPVNYPQISGAKARSIARLRGLWS